MSWLRRRPRHRIGRYQLIAHMARGGMADIYLARQSGHAGFEKLVVLKCIRPEFARKPEHLTMFVDEARLCARLEHPNLVQVLDVVASGRQVFMVMEYLNGESLVNLLRGGPGDGLLPPVVAAAVVKQVADGLHYAHTLQDGDGSPLNIVHRDVSPENLLVLYDGRVKLLDFGIAKTEIRSTETQTGGFKGKVGYMSPEHITGSDLDGRSDVFSLGVVLWECLTGRRLYDGENVWQVMETIVREDAPPASDYREALPAELVSASRRALARERDRRLGSAAELAGLLSDFLRATGVGSDPTPIVQLMRERFKDRPQARQIVVERAHRTNQTLDDDRIVDISATLTDPDFEALELQELARHTVDLAIMPVGDTKWRAPAAVLLALVLVAGGLGLVLMRGGGGASSADAGPAIAVAAADASQGAEPALDSGSGDAAVVDGGQGRDGQPSQLDAGSHGGGRRPGKVRNRQGRVRRKAAAARSGKLRLVTRPWANIYYRGRMLGQSPLVDVELPVGRVKLRAKNSAAGINKTFVVEVEPGPKPTKRSIKLD